MLGGINMVETKSDACAFIESMTDVEFLKLCNFLNTTFEKSAERQAAEKRFVKEVKAAEKSVVQGNYVTLSQLHEFLGV